MSTERQPDKTESPTELDSSSATEVTEFTAKAPNHAAPEGAQRHPLIDLSRDPNPGVADHAKPDED